MFIRKQRQKLYNIMFLRVSIEFFFVVVTFYIRVLLTYFDTYEDILPDDMLLLVGENSILVECI